MKQPVARVEQAARREQVSRSWRCLAVGVAVVWTPCCVQPQRVCRARRLGQACTRRSKAPPACRNSVHPTRPKRATSADSRAPAGVALDRAVAATFAAADYPRARADLIAAQRYARQLDSDESWPLSVFCGRVAAWATQYADAAWPKAAPRAAPRPVASGARIIMGGSWGGRPRTQIEVAISIPNQTKGNKKKKIAWFEIARKNQPIGSTGANRPAAGGHRLSRSRASSSTHFRATRHMASASRKSSAPPASHRQAPPPRVAARRTESATGALACDLASSSPGLPSGGIMWRHSVTDPDPTAGVAAATPPN